MLDSSCKWEAHAEGVDAPRVVPMRYPPRAVRRSIEYINANFAGEIRLKDIAAAVGMSKFHLARTFRASTGVTLHHYLTRTRVERVKALLLDSDQYAREIDEVRRLGARDSKERSADQTAAAIFSLIGGIGLACFPRRFIDRFTLPIVGVHELPAWLGVVQDWP